MTVKKRAEEEGISDLPLTRRQRQALETKDKLYNAAVREINEKGFSNVSIEDITTAAQVAKGTFYTHFESKEALIFYTFQQSDDVYRRAYEQVREEAFLPAVTAFMRRSYTEYERRGKGIIKAMISHYFSLPRHDFYGKDRALLQCLGKLVERGKREGDLDPVRSTEAYVALLVSTVVGVEVMWCLDEQGQRLADMVEDAIHVTALGMTAAIHEM